MTVAGQTSRLDANEIWEFLFNRTKDAVPEELTNEILADLAAHINKLWIDPLTELQHRREVQCCMCGKTGLSTVEGDGGQECELDDGRWVCSGECWDRAAASPASGVRVKALDDDEPVTPTSAGPLYAVSRAAVIEECISEIERFGNFGDYQRHELTADLGQPRFDFMQGTIARLRALIAVDNRCDYCREHGFRHPNLCQDCREKGVLF